jgi:hypothetical protein
LLGFGDLGGVIGTVSLIDQTVHTIAAGGFQPAYGVYCPVNDLFIFTDGTGHILRVTPEPLAILSSTAFAGASGLCVYNQVTELVYIVGGGTIFAYDPVGDVIVATAVFTGGGRGFFGVPSCDETNGILYIAAKDIDGSFDDLAVIRRYDISGGGLNFINQITATPFDTGGGCRPIGVGAFFCPGNNLLYYMGKDENTNVISLTRYNPQTTAFTNTTPIPAVGGGFPVYDPVSKLVYLSSDLIDFNHMDVYCSLSDDVAGSIALDNAQQGCYAGAFGIAYISPGAPSTIQLYH